MARLLKRSTEMLSCRLTPAEFEARANDLAASIEAYKAELELQSSTRADMKAKLAELERQRDELARVVSRRAEDRLVDVLLCARDEAGIAEYVRMDTGEIYSERPLKAEERQLTLVDSPEAS